MIFEKSNLRVFWYEILFLYYSYCSSSLGFANLFCFLFTIPDFFVACFLALPFFLPKLPSNGNSLNQMPYSPLPSSWKLLSVNFSAILCYLFTLLYSSETPNAFTSSLQISYLVSHSGEFLGLVFSGTI